MRSPDRLRVLLVLSIAALSLIGAAPVHGQGPTDDILSKATFVQRLDQPVPLDLPFVDSSGQPVRLGDFFGDRPIILTLGYFDCPNLCDLVRQGLAHSLQQIAFVPGKDFDVIAVSIDPKETPALSAPEKAEFAVEYARRDVARGLHFLTGAQESIQRLADAVGFEYAYDPAIQQFAHPAGIILLTPQGKVSRYFYGVDFSPQDLRLGLVDASESRIGTLLDQVILRCYHYDPSTGKYNLAILSVLRAAGIVTVLALAVFVYRVSHHATVS